MKENDSKPREDMSAGIGQPIEANPILSHTALHRRDLIICIYICICMDMSMEFFLMQINHSYLCRRQNLD